MEIIFNKLVRDNIPDIMAAEKEIPVTRILSQDEYRQELYRKLEEECQEVIKAQTSQQTIEELADVLEVITAIAELETKNINEVMIIAEKKKLKKGGFSKKIYLEKSIKDN